MAGWLTVTLLSLALLIPCGLAGGVLIPMIAYRQSESAMGTLTIEYDNNSRPSRRSAFAAAICQANEFFRSIPCPFESDWLQVITRSRGQKRSMKTQASGWLSWNPYRSLS